MGSMASHHDQPLFLLSFASSARSRADGRQGLLIPRASGTTEAAATGAVETIEDAQSIIVRAAETRDVDPDTVIDAIR